MILHKHAAVVVFSIPSCPHLSGVQRSPEKGKNAKMHVESIFWFVRLAISRVKIIVFAVRSIVFLGSSCP